MGLVVAAAVVLAGYRLHPILGLGLVIAIALGLAVYLLRDDLARGLAAALGFLGRPVGWAGLALLGAWIVTAPAILHFDAVKFEMEPERAHHP